MRHALFCLALIALGAAAVALTGWSPSSAPAPEARVASRTASPTAATDARWTPGDHTRYALSSARSMRSGDANLRFTVDGSWSVRVAEAYAVGATLVIQLADARLTAGAAGAARPIAPQGVAEPFGLRLGPSGRVEAIGFSPTVEPSARTLLASLVADLHVSGLDGIEASPVGRVQVRHVRSEDQLVRRVIRVERPASLAGQPAPRDLQVEVVESATKVELAKGLPERIEHRERLRYSGLKGLDATSAVETTARRVAFERAAVPAVDPGWRWGPMDAPPPRANLRSSLDRDLLKGADLTELIDDFDTLGADARAKRMARLMALFRLHPESIDAATARIQQGDPAERQLIGALSAAGTPRAQAALAELIGDGALDDELRAVATIQLGLVEAPTAATADALTTAWEDGAGDIAHNAALALGSVSRAHPKALEPLLAALADADSPSATRHYLNALGNAGDPRVEAAMLGALDDSNESVRAAATYGLRFVPGDAIEARLTQLAGQDASSMVRRRAEQALLARNRR